MYAKLVAVENYERTKKQKGFFYGVLVVGWNHRKGDGKLSKNIKQKHDSNREQHIYF
jgi:hypothetical protein